MRFWFFRDYSREYGPEYQRQILRQDLDVNYLRGVSRHHASISWNMEAGPFILKELYIKKRFL